MKFELGNIAAISSGNTFRGRVENDPLGDCAVIQMKDLDTKFYQVKDTMHKVSKQSIPSSQILRQGDVLFLAKGANNHAIVFQKNYPAVASSVFFVLRPDPEKITSEYLALYLNQESTQLELQSAKEGSVVTNINMTALAKQQIKVPSMLTQKKLVNLYKLWQVEKEQTQKLLEKKEKYYNNLVLDEIEREREVAPYTDDSSRWVGYELSGNYYIANFVFKESVYIKGFAKAMNKMSAIIIEMEQYQRTIKESSGSTKGYMAVKEWHLIKPSDLRTWNDPTVPHEQKITELLNVIPHSLIESITMVDRQGNYVEPINPWK
ncbi:MAG TPA: restriction endonuclease subunit S [Bacteroidia bacterium]|nr:restriction endonuclease subunit S [Bacteroidia bacterium]